MSYIDDEAFDRGAEAGAQSGVRMLSFRLTQWLRDPARKPAHLHFTAGPERELADEIELAIQRAKAKIDEPEEEAGRG